MHFPVVAEELELVGDWGWIWKPWLLAELSHLATRGGVSSASTLAHQGSWSCCRQLSSPGEAGVFEEDCFVDEWGFSPPQNVYKNTSEYFLLAECRFEMDISARDSSVSAYWTLCQWEWTSSLFFTWTYLHFISAQIFTPPHARDTNVCEYWKGKLYFHQLSGLGSLFRSVWPNSFTAPTWALLSRTFLTESNFHIRPTPEVILQLISCRLY